MVELSIVLVILGLLTGGILTGQSLIRASELRKVTAQYERYVVAVNNFKDRYFALPGDMTNATSVWGKSSVCGGSLTEGTCDGNGDGVIGVPRGVYNSTFNIEQTSENYQFWRQLALSGLIEGVYSGTTIQGDTLKDCVPGVNVPVGPMTDSGYSVDGIGVVPRWAGDYGNSIVFGGRIGIFPTSNPMLKTEEAWNIDIKFDDGSPANGGIRTYTKVSVWRNCPTTNVQSTTNYNLSYGSQACVLVFLKPF